MQEVLNLYNEYTQWFNGNTLLTPIESETKPTIKIETPFLDSHNDGMIFYMQKLTEDTVILTDDGWYLQDLEACGIDLNNERIRELLRHYCTSFDIQIIDDELVAIAKIDANLPVRINFYTQALILIANIN